MVERAPSREARQTAGSILNRDFVETVLVNAQENLKDHGHLVPVLFMHFESGQRAISTLSLPDTVEERREHFSQIGESIRQGGKAIREALFVTQAWYVRADEQPSPLDLPLSQHPGRTEMITIVGRNAQATRATLLLQPFSRDEANRPVFRTADLAQYDESSDADYRPLGLIDHLFD